MKLYFLRHGIAEEHRPGLPDGERHLTPEGVEEMRAVGRALKLLELELDTVLTSPLVRARDTARLAAEALGLEDRVREEIRLASGCGFQDLAAALEGVPEKARVLLVGHEPDFSTLISQLIGGGAVRMKKASLASVDAPRIAPGAGELRWLLTSGQLRKLGGP